MLRIGRGLIIIKFKIKEEPSFVRVIFYRKSAEKVPNNAEKAAKNRWITVEKVANNRWTSEKPAKNSVMTEQESIIYEFVLNNHKINLKETENLLGIKAARAREILSNMVKKWILEKIGKTKGSYYILKTEQNNK